MVSPVDNFSMSISSSDEGDFQDASSSIESDPGVSATVTPGRKRVRKQPAKPRKTSHWSVGRTEDRKIIVRHNPGSQGGGRRDASLYNSFIEAGALILRDHGRTLSILIKKNQSDANQAQLIAIKRIVEAESRLHHTKMEEMVQRKLKLERTALMVEMRASVSELSGLVQRLLDGHGGSSVISQPDYLDLEPAGSEDNGCQALIPPEHHAPLSWDQHQPAPECHTARNGHEGGGDEIHFEEMLSASVSSVINSLIASGAIQLKSRNP